MAELTQGMIDEGATFIDANGIPTRADGTPIRGWGWGEAPVVPAGDGGSLLASIARMAGQSGDVPTDGRGGGPEGKAPPEEMQIVNGFPYPEDPLGYAFGPTYAASQQDFPDNRAPLDPEWQWGQEGGKWEDYYTPNDRSTGGGFFLAKDALGGEVPFSYQQGASSPSTNNWRLLGSTPEFIMRNGYIINRFHPQLRYPFANTTENAIFGNTYKSGATMGFPSAFAYGNNGPAFAGWPGADNWAQLGITLG